MQRLSNNLLLTFWLGMSLPLGIAHAQNVHFLNDQEVTKENLIDALKPRSSNPQPAVTPRTRGIHLGTSQAPPRTDAKLECAYYRKKTAAGGSRGIRMGSENSDPVALRVTFAYNSAEITHDSQATLDTLGEALQSAQLQQCCFRIEGHTDDRGADAYNQKLSERRAQSVVNYLVKKFKLDHDRLSAEGYGKKRPIESNQTEEGRQKNRRVQIVNLGYAQQVSE